MTEDDISLIKYYNTYKNQCGPFKVSSYTPYKISVYSRVVCFTIYVGQIIS